MRYYASRVGNELLYIMCRWLQHRMCRENSCYTEIYCGRLHIASNFLVAAKVSML